ncbi:hypothetical protein QMK19_34215 [Streptomyces sp. H10-C2]|uniref:hypothetical protein n=1 Tax=unclassified Streptomyces TaxID=2593676 RepID=UPI0024B8B786|nr:MULTISPECIES: hypothetical protein [unclassified Streptomyces]MDJ0345692.1 hypothetical protein [Streptomyces sp. PH10-H1]MDJ0374544.1 hypothetical protein [Streptomyces sp. H10-C2]
MARPATGQTKPISFRPPPQLLAEFDATVEDGRTRSDVLIELMHDRVKKKQRGQTAGAPAPGPFAVPVEREEAWDVVSTTMKQPDPGSGT